MSVATAFGTAKHKTLSDYLIKFSKPKPAKKLSPEEIEKIKKEVSEASRAKWNLIINQKKSGFKPKSKLRPKIVKPNTPKPNE